jgi:chromosome segregation ATPase
LQIEYENAENDDRTAIYQELEEELKVTYLEYDRLQGDIQTANAEALRLENQLKAADFKVSTENLNELHRRISELQTENAEYKSKWSAYQIKMHKMAIEARIALNRKNSTPASTTVKAAADEHRRYIARLNQLATSMDAQDDSFSQHVQELAEIIDGQRRRLVKCLIGNDS